LENMLTLDPHYSVSLRTEQTKCLNLTKRPSTSNVDDLDRQIRQRRPHIAGLRSRDDHHRSETGVQRRACDVTDERLAAPQQQLLGSPHASKRRLPG
jgi:hypothetical protein